MLGKEYYLYLSRCDIVESDKRKQTKETVRQGVFKIIILSDSFFALLS